MNIETFCSLGTGSEGLCCELYFKRLSDILNDSKKQIKRMAY